MQKAVIRTGVLGILGAISLAVSCSPGDPLHKAEAEAAKEPAASPVNAPLVAPVSAPVHENVVLSTWTEVQGEVIARVDTVDKKLRRIPNLSRKEREQLRRDVNAIQIERARTLGIQPGTPVEKLVSSGKLVRLADSTEYWVIRPLHFSEPYLTPSGEAMLAEIGKRFHAKLDSLSIPRFRLDITSILRTPDKQAALRRANSNASRIESAHEFGTTVDLAYRRFAAPLDDRPLDLQARFMADSLMVDAARLRAAELQAVLGRVLQEMQNEGKLMVRMERRQTVYHITVAKPFNTRNQTAAD